LIQLERRLRIALSWLDQRSSVMPSHTLRAHHAHLHQITSTCQPEG